MTRSALNIAAPQVRGWCPGALRPMQSGDGLIVRLRPRGHALSAGDLIAIAAMRRSVRQRADRPDAPRQHAAARRAPRATCRPCGRSSERIGLLERPPEAEAVRNVLISPLAGVDPSEMVDARALADELDAALTQNSALWTLPAKFAFVIDGGGALPLDGRARRYPLACRRGVSADRRRHRPAGRPALDWRARRQAMPSPSPSAWQSASSRLSAEFAVAHARRLDDRTSATSCAQLASCAAASASQRMPGRKTGASAAWTLITIDGRTIARRLRRAVRAPRCGDAAPARRTRAAALA